MIVIGVTSNTLRERLLQIDNLSLEDAAVKIGQAAKATKKHAQELCRTQLGNQTIDALQVKPNYNKLRIQKQENNES